MRLKDDYTVRGELDGIRELPPGPERIARLVALLQEDLAKFPLHLAPPPAVVKAHRAFTDSVTFGQQITGAIEKAEEAQAEAHAKDVAAARRAAKSGRPLPAATEQSAAAAAMPAAILSFEAAEALLSDAHGELVDAIQEAWPSWRASLAGEAGVARSTAAEAAREAAEEIAAARAFFDAVGVLDAEIRARYPKVKAATEREMLAGVLGWYAATHTGANPLKHVAVPGLKGDRGAPVNADLVEVARALQQKVAAGAEWPTGEWLPPEDPRHDEVLAAPLNLEAGWVKHGLLRVLGSTCELCGRPRADAITTLDGKFIPVHASCLRNPPTPEIRKSVEQLKQWQREGIPSNQPYAVDAESGAHVPMAET